MSGRFVQSDAVSEAQLGLNKAVYRNDKKTVRAILNSNPSFINTIIQPHMDSPLSNALRRSPVDMEMLGILTGYGVTFDYPVNPQKMYPLEVACQTKNEELLQFLLNHKAMQTEKAPHYLLSQTHKISLLTEANVMKLSRMISLLGGLDKIADTTNENGETFQQKARESLLINSVYGSLTCDYMNLLTLAEKIQSSGSYGEDYPTQKIELHDALRSMREAYYKKESEDKPKLGHSIHVLFHGSGAGLDPDNDNDERMSYGVRPGITV
ncbi:Dot/Icm T4SS effector AnkJ/LegA11 [Legionella spiritensis]|uniref:Ankyrin repeat-containing protein n=1 Tax=Legionella spiritensis TaxID=452 RepID=A0A0W0YW60_LEGSP|nr:Dot/Icm T4SS effector AnkJ/LegA11 [Legionella spiritensis]KTD61111.1 ankyrin repeat-containing protein [Legionella spiritensis]SNV44963.1 ankyrin repeat-containing protein [Legionella spiritensis]